MIDTSASSSTGSPSPSAGRGAPAPSAPARTPAAALVPDLPRMLATVQALAGGIGPREATSPGFRKAADLVEDQLADLGYDVRRQSFSVPAGVSWGVRVPAGTSVNVIAHPVGFDPARPYLLFGAHLDTVPQSAGAVDNGSGVAVLLEVARLSRLQGSPVQVTFVLFGAEEPRGGGDDRHHYGSRTYVAAMSQPARAGLVGMLSLDRVGVGQVVRVCTGGRGSPAFAQRVIELAEGGGIRSRLCENRGSDHWPFEKAGLPAARLLGSGYAEYHTSRDRPEVVDPDQLLRMTRVAWEAATQPTS